MFEREYFKIILMWLRKNTMKLLHVENQYCSVLHVKHIAQCNIMCVKPMVDKDKVEI